MADMAYVAKWPCGCILSVHCISEISKSGIVSWLKEVTEEGALIEQVEVEQIRNGTIPLGHKCGK